MGLLEKIQQFYKKYPILVIAIAVVVALPLLGFAVATPVRVGIKTLCKYGHVVKDDTYTTVVFRWNADDASVTTKTTICDKHQKLEALWDKARKAQKEGNKKKALDIFRMIQASDPNFRNIEIVVGELEGQTGDTGGDTAGGGTSGDSPGDGTPGTQPEFSGDITSLFPTSLDGYTMVNNSPGRLEASRMYVSDPAKHPKVQLLTIVINQLNTEEMAEEFINNEIKTYYGADPRATTVNGVKAYFGTDNELAMLAYHINGIVFEIEMRPSSGPPKDLFDDTVGVANDVP
jgi:hypothetical protein